MAAFRPVSPLLTIAFFIPSSLDFLIPPRQMIGPFATNASAPTKEGLALIWPASLHPLQNPFPYHLASIFTNYFGRINGTGEVEKADSAAYKPLPGIRVCSGNGCHFLRQLSTISDTFSTPLSQSSRLYPRYYCLPPPLVADTPLVDHPAQLHLHSLKPQSLFFSTLHNRLFSTFILV